MAEPNPQRHHLLSDPEAVASVRRLDCKFYVICLNTACIANWPGWACGDCDAYEAEDGMTKIRFIRALKRGMQKELQARGLLPPDDEGE